MKKYTLISMFIVAALLAGVIYLGSSPGATQAQDTMPEVESGLDSISWFTCQVSRVAVFTNRIHVKCLNSPGGGIYYFSASSTYPNEVLANRYLTILNTAYALNQNVAILWDSNSANNPAGCLISDCRSFVGLDLAK